MTESVRENAEQTAHFGPFGETAVVVLQAIVGASPARALTTTPDDTYTTNRKVYATALSENRKILYST